VTAGGGLQSPAPLAFGGMAAPADLRPKDVAAWAPRGMAAGWRGGPTGMASRVGNFCRYIRDAPSMHTAKPARGNSPLCSLKEWNVRSILRVDRATFRNKTGRFG
jgi:hypothetical protein